MSIASQLTDINTLVNKCIDIKEQLVDVLPFDDNFKKDIVSYTDALECIQQGHVYQCTAVYDDGTWEGKLVYHSMTTTMRGPFIWVEGFNGKTDYWFTGVDPTAIDGIYEQQPNGRWVNSNGSGWQLHYHSTFYDNQEYISWYIDPADYEVGRIYPDFSELGQPTLEDLKKFPAHKIIESQWKSADWWYQGTKISGAIVIPFWISSDKYCEGTLISDIAMKLKYNPDKIVPEVGKYYSGDCAICYSKDPDFAPVVLVASPGFVIFEDVYSGLYYSESKDFSTTESSISLVTPPSSSTDILEDLVIKAQQLTYVTDMCATHYQPDTSYNLTAIPEICENYYQQFGDTVEVLTSCLKGNTDSSHYQHQLECSAKLIQYNEEITPVIWGQEGKKYQEGCTTYNADGEVISSGTTDTYHIAQSHITIDADVENMLKHMVTFKESGSSGTDEEGNPVSTYCVTLNSEVASPMSLAYYGTALFPADNVYYQKTLDGYTQGLAMTARSFGIPRAANDKKYFDVTGNLICEKIDNVSFNLNVEMYKQVHQVDPNIERSTTRMAIKVERTDYYNIYYKIADGEWVLPTNFHNVGGGITQQPVFLTADTWISEYKIDHELCSFEDVTFKVELARDMYLNPPDAVILTDILGMGDYNDGDDYLSHALNIKQYDGYYIIDLNTFNEIVSIFNPSYVIDEILEVIIPNGANFTYTEDGNIKVDGNYEEDSVDSEGIVPLEIEYRGAGGAKSSVRRWPKSATYAIVSVSGSTMIINASISVSIGGTTLSGTGSPILDSEDENGNPDYMYFIRDVKVPIHFVPSYPRFSVSAGTNIEDQLLATFSFSSEGGGHLGSGAGGYTYIYEITGYKVINGTKCQITSVRCINDPGY